MKVSFIRATLKSFDWNYSLFSFIYSEEITIKNLRVFSKSLGDDTDRSLTAKEVYNLFILLIFAISDVPNIAQKAETLGLKVKRGTKSCRLLEDIYKNLLTCIEMRPFWQAMVIFVSHDVGSFENFSSLYKQLKSQPKNYYWVNYLVACDLLSSNNIEAATQLTEWGHYSLRTLHKANLLKSNFETLCSLDKCNEISIFILISELLSQDNLTQNNFDILLKNRDYTNLIVESIEYKLMVDFGLQFAFIEISTRSEGIVDFEFTLEDELMLTVGKKLIDITADAAPHLNAIRKFFDDYEKDKTVIEFFYEIAKKHNLTIRKGLTKDIFHFLFMELPATIIEVVTNHLVEVYNENPALCQTLLKSNELAKDLARKSVLMVTIVNTVLPNLRQFIPAKAKLKQYNADKTYSLITEAVKLTNFSTLTFEKIADLAQSSRKHHGARLG